MKELLLIIVPSALTYLFARRKENVDLCGERMDQLEKSILVYNKIIDDLSGKIDGLKKEVTKLEARIEDLMTENKKLKKYNSL